MHRCGEKVTYQDIAQVTHLLLLIGFLLWSQVVGLVVSERAQFDGPLSFLLYLLTVPLLTLIMLNGGNEKRLTLHKKESTYW